MMMVMTDEKIERRYPLPHRASRPRNATPDRIPDRRPRRRRPRETLGHAGEPGSRPSIVSRAVSSRNTLPVLANVLLKTEDAGLKLTATNLEIGITYWVPGKIDDRRRDDRPGPAAHRPRQLAAGGRRVDLELGRGRDAPHPGRALRVAHQGHRRRGLPGRSRPPASDRRRGSPRRSSGRPSTRRRSRRPSDEARPILTGVLARFEGDQLTLAAADNYRIAVKTIPILDPVEETSVVIPARALNELIADPGRHRRPGRDRPRPAPATSSCSTSRASTSSAGSSTASSRTTSRSCRRAHATRAVLDREELLRAVRPAALIAARVGEHREAPGRRSTASPGSPSAPTPRSATTSAGSRPPSRATGPRSRSTRGTSPTSSTNVDADQFALELNGPLSPGVFKPVGDDRYVHVVMPRPDDVLTRSAPTTAATAGERRAARPLASRDLRGVRRPRRGLRRRAAARRRARTPPARRACSRRSSLLAWGRSHRTIDRRRAHPLGRGRSPGSRARSATTTIEVALVRRRAPRRRRGRKRIRVNGVAAPGAALVGRLCASSLFAPEEMLLVVGSPSLRRAALDQLARPSVARPTPTTSADVRPDAPAAEQPAPRDPRGAGRPATSCASGTRRSSTPAGAIVAERAATRSSDLAEPLAGPIARSRPDEAGAAR